jgi:hypothetical protein
MGITPVRVQSTQDSRKGNRQWYPRAIEIERGVAAMNRVRNYIGFAVWFSGLGYMALWPLTAADGGLAVLDFSFLCDRPFALDALCQLNPAWQLSPGLHLAGTTSAAYVLMALALRPLRRWRRKRASAADIARLDIEARLKLVRRPLPPPPGRYVRPRSQFGLRGAPHLL